MIHKYIYVYVLRLKTKIGIHLTFIFQSLPILHVLITKPKVIKFVIYIVKVTEYDNVCVQKKLVLERRDVKITTLEYSINIL